VTIDDEETDDMTPEEERLCDAAYANGERRILAKLSSLIAAELYGHDRESHEARLHALEAERLDVVTVLRRICAEHGDNDWSNDLNLVDVLEKHLESYLEQTK
jgi:hypothetical protein